MTIKEQILDLLADGEWHTTSEMQELGERTTVNRLIYVLRKEGINIETKKDPEISLGWIFRISSTKPSKQPTQYEQLIDTLSDCRWHSSSKLKDLIPRSLADYLYQMRKEGFFIEKEYDKYSKEWCYRVKMV